CSFFFSSRRRHTRSYGDWSSDVCSSDLASGAGLFFQENAPLPAIKSTPLTPGRTTYYFRSSFLFTGELSRAQLQLRPLVDDGAEIGRASCRERVGNGGAAGPVKRKTSTS